ncbi:MAG: PilT/PilU family type 4a pilus ATPase [Patescibacteria group bacterium]
MDYKKELEDIILSVIKEGGSDIHFSANRRPTIRIAGNLIPLVKKDILTPDDTLGFLGELVSRGIKDEFLKTKEIDFSYMHGTEGRFRGNAFFQRGAIGIVLRFIPRKIKTIAELNLPDILNDFSQKKQGFFLTVGPVGQGKSTTLAAMVDKINHTRAEHVVTIEDPIEYLFTEDRCIIDQREVRIDTRDFYTALTSAFRQDVDVLMIGEMRGHDTIGTAVTAAETGHLVLSTLHTNNASQTVDRIIGSFPADGQEQIRVQLAGSLLGIFSQRLVPRVSGGLIPAYELLINNNAVSNLIREGRTHEINVVIETGAEHGMIDMNQSLAELVRAGEIRPDDAYLYSLNPKGLEKLI